jgi:hypothetical protein
VSATLRFPAAFAAALAALLPGAAAALEGCKGTYSAGVYGTLPAGAAVALDPAHSSPVAPNLIQAFNNGLAQSGRPTGGTPGILLRLHYSVFTQQTNPGTGMGAMREGMTGGSSGWTTAPTPGSQDQSFTGTQSGMGTTGGGPELQMPGLPEFGSYRLGPAPASPPVLIVRATARVAGADRDAWVANLQCRATNTNSQDIAFQLGMFIGGILGQRVEGAPM